jgi:hypothetical protein
MAKVVNLNRYRKKRAKADKEARAERNRRVHGRTKAERMAEALAQRKLHQTLEGAYLGPERVDVEQLVEKHPAEALEVLEQMTHNVVPVSEFAARLLAQQRVQKDADEDDPEG